MQVSFFLLINPWRYKAVLPSRPGRVHTYCRQRRTVSPRCHGGKARGSGARRPRVHGPSMYMYVAAGARRSSHSLARQRLRRAKESKPCQHVRDRERQRHRTWAAGPGITRGYAQPANNIFLSHQTSINQSVIIFSHDKSALTTSRQNRVSKNYRTVHRC